MRKIGAILLMSILILSLAACQKKEAGEADQAGKENNEEQVVSSEDMPDEIYGKVISIVGNEMELKLGNLPDEMTEPDEEIKQEAPSGDGEAMASVTPAMEIDPDMFELEYTGETMKLTVNAGIPVKNMEKESSLSSIKEGGILRLAVEDAKAEKIEIEEIQIIK